MKRIIREEYVRVGILQRGRRGARDGTVSRDEDAVLDVSRVDAASRDDDAEDPLAQVFSSFDPVPLGSASIGQVHRAVLRETNTPVVVKVQYPSAERNFRIDMALFLYATKALAPGFAEILEVFQSNFKNEFDL